MNDRLTADDRRRQWCAVAGIGAVMALTAAVHFGEPPHRYLPPAAEVARDITLPAPAASVVPSSPAPAVRTRRVPDPVPVAENEDAPDPVWEAPAVLSEAPAVFSEAPAVLAGRPLLEAHTAAALQAPVAPSPRPIRAMEPTRRRGAVTRALIRAGAETGRGFRRVGDAFERVF
jgi:hypothetical protein